MDDGYIGSVFNADGLLAQALDGYVLRQGQIDFAQAVADALYTKDNLVAEAPTGSGKSFAYAVPAVHHAIAHNQRIAIVTANIALQEQLVTKDLPLLQRVLPEQFTFALAKGRANYLCLNKIDEAKEFDRIENLSALYAWVNDTEHGDVTELAEYAPELLRDRGRFTSGTDDCLGNDCAFRDRCHAQQAKARAEGANIVVSNYHLLFANLKVMEVTDGAVGILPPIDAVVFDEAHKAADIARDFFGATITRRKVTNAIANLDPSSRFDAEQHTSAFFNALTSYVDRTKASRLYERFPDEHWTPIYNAIMSGANYYNRRCEETVDPKERNRWASRAKRAWRTGEAICDLCALADEDCAYFIEVDRRGYASLHSKVIVPGPVIKNLLWDKIDSAVLTSATLAVGGNFNHLFEETGLANATTMEVETPFNFMEQCALFVPSMPDPRDNDWPMAVADRVVETIKLARGRTLCLFTSYRMLDMVHQDLLSRGLPYRILRQGLAAERTKLVRQFKEDVSSVLLGTESFWAGVDVPGEACSAVVIDKLPFPSPKDPVMEALNERAGREAFFVHSIPRAVIQFKQGFGRLIRRAEDRGVVVILDHRIKSKSYGRKFIRSLPEVPIYQDLDRISEILG